MILLLIRLTLISFLKNHGYANPTYVIRVYITPKWLVKLQIELLIKSYISQIILVNTQMKTQHIPCITSSQSKSTQNTKNSRYYNIWYISHINLINTLRGTQHIPCITSSQYLILSLTFIYSNLLKHFFSKNDKFIYVYFIWSYY